MLSEPEYCFQPRRPSLLAKVMLKRIRDEELGIGDFRLRNPRYEQLVGPRGLDDHGRGQARSGALRGLTDRWCRGWMDPEEFSKVWLTEACSAEASLCIT